MQFRLQHIAGESMYAWDSMLMGAEYMAWERWAEKMNENCFCHTILVIESYVIMMYAWATSTIIIYVPLSKIQTHDFRKTGVEPYLSIISINFFDAAQSRFDNILQRILSWVALLWLSFKYLRYNTSAGRNCLKCWRTKRLDLWHKSTEAKLTRIMYVKHIYDAIIWPN